MNNWKEMVRVMRLLGWRVHVTAGWVDVETPFGRQGGFERSERGLKLAWEFYRKQVHAPTGGLVPLPVAITSRRRVQPVGALTCWLLILGCAVLDGWLLYHCTLVPAAGPTCALFTLLTMPVYVVAVRRLGRR